MLQGDNRLDRMLKWMQYLKWYYQRDVHAMRVAPGVGHDPVQVRLSSPYIAPI